MFYLVGVGGELQEEIYFSIKPVLGWLSAGQTRILVLQGWTTEHLAPTARPGELQK